MPDGRTIEMHYQCDIKGYEPGGTNWKLGKGKPPLSSINSWEAYYGLWETWAKANPDLMKELRIGADKNEGYLSDVFASTSISQARALAELLNKGY